MNNGKNVDSANLCMVFSVSLVFCLATIGVGVFRCADFGWRTFLFVGIIDNKTKLWYNCFTTHFSITYFLSPFGGNTTLAKGVFSFYSYTRMENENCVVAIEGTCFFGASLVGALFYFEEGEYGKLF